MLWHYRLWHLSIPRLQKVKQNYSEIKVPTESFCSICPLAKQHRISFPTHVAASKCHFEL